MPRSLILSTLAIALASIAACSDAPRSVPVTKSPPATMSSQLPPNHPAIDPGSAHPDLPAGHAAGDQAAGSDDPSEFAGRATLHGELAHATTGAFFVSLYEVGERLPIWMYVVDLGDPNRTKLGLADAVGDTRVLQFALNQKTTLLPARVPADKALEVRITYDPDRDVISKDGQVVGSTPAKPGDLELSLDLGAERSK